MKSKIIILLLLCVNSIFAQLPVLSITDITNPASDPTNEPNFSKTGNYRKDINNDRNQYVGLWRYNQNGVLFELKIEKFDKLINKFIDQNIVVFYNYSDAIVFKYRLVKNGVELYNNLNATITENYDSSALKYGIYDFADGLMVDATHNVRSSVMVKKINSNPEKIIFTLSSGSYHYLNPKSYYDSINVIFTIPLDGIEMVRVN